MKTPNLRNDSFITEPKNVEDTKMLNTMARESVDMNESNPIEEHVVSHPSFGPDGATGRSG